MIILLSSVAAVVKAFWGFVTNNGGVVLNQGRLPLLLKRQQTLYTSTLLSTCDSGKAGALYFITLID